jgi:hypothetical protein
MLCIDKGRLGCRVSAKESIIYERKGDAWCQGVFSLFRRFVGMGSGRQGVIWPQRVFGWVCAQVAQPPWNSVNPALLTTSK